MRYYYLIFIQAGLCFGFAAQHQKVKHSKKGNTCVSNNDKEHKVLEASRFINIENVPRRRFIFAGLVFCGAHLPISDAKAGEVGAKITKAVTTSDLGIEVRKSVVRGAQVMDRLDGSWERFSDKFNLGAERSKRDSLPKPRVIPERKPLDQRVATRILQTSDEVFLSVLPQSSGWNQESLKKKVEATQELVRKSFERSGLTLEDSGTPQTAEGFNFLCYAHFRAYNDILVLEKSAIRFGEFKSSFEQKLGEQLLPIFIDDGPVGSHSDLKSTLELAKTSITEIMVALKERGLVASHEESEVTDDKIQDWVDDLSELPFTIGVDGDATLQAQILLQEQGYRLYPNLSRLMVASLLARMFRPLKQSVSCDEYYLDTDYNSDPDKFEVKQVLLNVVLDSVN